MSELYGLWNLDHSKGWYRNSPGLFGQVLGWCFFWSALVIRLLSAAGPALCWHLAGWFWRWTLAEVSLLPVCVRLAWLVLGIYFACSTACRSVQMVPGGTDFYREQEAEGSDCVAQGNRIRFAICFSSGRQLDLRFIGTGRRCERQQGFIGDLVPDTPVPLRLYDRFEVFRLRLPDRKLSFFLKIPSLAGSERETQVILGKWLAGTPALMRFIWHGEHPGSNGPAA